MPEFPHMREAPPEAYRSKEYNSTSGAAQEAVLEEGFDAWDTNMMHSDGYKGRFQSSENIRRYYDDIMLGGGALMWEKYAENPEHMIDTKFWEEVDFVVN